VDGRHAFANLGLVLLAALGASDGARAASPHVHTQKLEQMDYAKARKIIWTTVGDQHQAPACK